MTMTKYIVQRLLISIPVFLGITLIVFALFALSPGDPVVNIIGYGAFVEMSPEQVLKIRQQFGLDDPWIVRYARWLGSTLQGDLGYPYKGAMSVSAQLAERVPPTLLLMGASLVLALLLGVPMGIIMALKPYSLIDYILTIIAFINLSIPSFFVGLSFIYIFALKLDILPTYGMQTIGEPFSLIDRVRHLILPATILGVFNAGVWARYTRSSMLEVLHTDYVTTARSKGLREWVVVLRHAFRNSLIPLITIVTLSLPALLGGAVIIETIFQWPGMGMLGYRATTTRDYPILMGITLISATMILVSNLLADILYAVADPRIRYN
ncbi:MAG: ABC transporter permease [Caldilineaceae bacterium]|nr:ABC transporter permease [Caldilineaceae bacterium]